MKPRITPFLAALIVTLLIVPVPASASGWCSVWPWLPVCSVSCGPGLTRVTGFGSNPGNLTMCTYVPADLEASRPLVVALHGCLQRADDFDDETGWTSFAEKHRFALLLPQQRRSNNPMKCFNWFEPGDMARDQGEAMSIRQMIDKMEDEAGIDPGRVYVTGLSAGGGMTAVMLAAYPERFAGGAIIAGIPYSCATDMVEAGQCGFSGIPGQRAPMKDLSPDMWGNLVRNASNHTGPYPRISIWQGTNDPYVNPENQRELVEQWTNVLGIDQIPDVEDTLKGHEHRLYTNADGDALVETVLVSGMGHATPIDPGTEESECGKPDLFTSDAGVCASFYIIKFWELNPE